MFFFFFNDTATTEIYTLSLHDALPISTVVENEMSSRIFSETFPKTSRIRFEFPEREGMPPLKFWWYDGAPGDKEVKALRPPEDITREVAAWQAQQGQGGGQGRRNREGGQGQGNENRERPPR